MIQHTCDNCGSTFLVSKNSLMITCPNCGCTSAREANDQESWNKLLAFARRELAAKHFSHAETAYNELLRSENKCHEAYWGRVLCRYGVEFVENSPTIHILRRQPILEDPDYLAACACAPDRSEYDRLAGYVSQVQRRLLELQAAKQEYDVFLCYKESGTDGRAEAPEFAHAQALCSELEQKGYSVFFASRSLKKGTGAPYEAQIFHAICTCKVMLVVCSIPAHMNTVWVRSEWSRFLERYYNNEDCQLIPVLFDGCELEKLPAALRALQCIRAEDDWKRVLDEKLEEVLGEKHTGRRSPERHELERELLNIKYELANGRWSDAAEDAEKLRRIHPDSPIPCLYKLLAKYQVATPDALRYIREPFEQEIDWKWAIQLASDSQKAQWNNILRSSRRRRQAEQERISAEAACQKEKQLADKRKAVRGALKAGEWERAQREAEGLTDSVPDGLLRLMARYKFATEKEMMESDGACFRDAMWSAMKANANDKEQVYLLQTEKRARDFRVKREKANVLEMAIGLLALLATFALVYCTERFGTGLPFDQGMFTTAIAGLMLSGVLAARLRKRWQQALVVFAVMGSVMALLLFVEFSSAGLLWLTFGICVMLLTFEVYLQREENREMSMAEVFLSLPALWLLLRSALMLLDEYFSWAWLSQARQCVYKGALIFLLFTMAIGVVGLVVCVLRLLRERRG